jgi:hypothetical protein
MGTNPDPRRSADAAILARDATPGRDDAASFGLSSALAECDASIEWYARCARIARIRHQTLEVALLLVGSAISVIALAVSDSSIIAALLGAVVVILTGLRQVFHWRDNYVRFTGACLALKSECRRYSVGQPPYDDEANRARNLIEALNRIEAEETHGWAERMQDKRPNQSTNT